MKQEDTKQKILEKALELFSARGYDAVSVGEIAKAVGIKAPSLYNHFPSKQAIFDAIVENTAAHYEKDTDGINVHVQDVRRDVPTFSDISADALAEKVRQIFLYSLHDQTISQLRRMMTLEQFRSPELAELYSRTRTRKPWHGCTFPQSSRCWLSATASRSAKPNVLQNWMPMCGCFSARSI